MPPDDHTGTQEHGRYVDSVLDLYRSHPDTTATVRRADRSLANDLYRQRIDLEIIDAAMLLVAARRSLNEGQPSNAIRSLHYFLPAIREVLENPLDDSYLAYLKQFTRQPLRNVPRLP